MAVDGKVNFEVDDDAFIGQGKNCEMCKNEEHDGYCSQCELYICQICFDNHLRIRSCRDHVLLQDTHEITTHDSAIRFETCDEHKQQEVKAYCTEHKCCVCIECILLRHKSCEWEYITDASNRFQNSGDLARLLEEVQGLEYTLDKCMEAIDKQTKTAETINTDVISNIESFTKSLVEFVVGSKQQIRDDAKVRESAHQQKLDTLKAHIQSLGSKVDEMITDFRNEVMLHKRFILAVETIPKVTQIQNELAAIDCNNVVTDYTFRPRNVLKRMMSNTRPIGRLTDASNIEEDEEDDDDIKSKKDRERSLGLEQQLEEYQQMMTKLKKDIHDMEQTYDGAVKEKQTLTEEVCALKYSNQKVVKDKESLEQEIYTLKSEKQTITKEKQLIAQELCAIRKKHETIVKEKKSIEQKLLTLKPTPEKSKFCDRCGAVKGNGLYCHECGLTFIEGYRDCYKCGTRTKARTCCRTCGHVNDGRLY